MAELRRRLTRLEQSAGALLPDQQRCPFCRGAKLLAFEDEPDNFGRPVLPYDGPGETCRLCRMPPPGKALICLSERWPELAARFPTLPWSDDPRRRFHEKLSLLKATIQRNEQEVERIVNRLHEDDASERRHWRYP